MVTLSDKFEAFVFDCDGVLWKENEPFPQAAETLKKLKYDKEGNIRKKIYYCTNNSATTPSTLKAKLKSLNFPDAEESECITPASIMPGLCAKLVDEHKKVLMCCKPVLTGALRDKMEADGSFNEVLTSSHLEKHFYEDLETQTKALENVDEEISVIVLGYDPYFCWFKLAYVQRICWLRHLKGKKTHVVHSNPDVNFPTPQGLLPGGGACGAMYDACLSTNEDVEKIMVGKPAKYLAEAIPGRRQACMIGDNLLTDIKFGEYFGGSILVETGIHQRHHVGNIEGGGIPTKIIAGVWELTDELTF